MNNQRRYSNKGNKRNNKNAKRRKYYNKNSRNGPHIVRLSQRGRFAADVTHLVLRFNDTVTQRSNIGTSFMNFRYRNSAYDPDPLVLTGALPGFKEYAPMYRFYLVEKMIFRVQVSNQDTVGVNYSMWPSNVDYGNNSLTAADIMEYSSNPGGTGGLLGAVSGMSRQSCTIVASLRKLYGSHGYTDLDYAGLTSGNPSLSFYVNFGATPCIGTFGFPLVFRITIDYHIKFFGVEQLKT